MLRKRRSKEQEPQQPRQPERMPDGEVIQISGSLMDKEAVAKHFGIQGFSLEAVFHIPTDRRVGVDASEVNDNLDLFALRAQGMSTDEMFPDGVGTTENRQYAGSLSPKDQISNKPDGADRISPFVQPTDVILIDGSSLNRLVGYLNDPSSVPSTAEEYREQIMNGITSHRVSQREPVTIGRGSSEVRALFSDKCGPDTSRRHLQLQAGPDGSLLAVSYGANGTTVTKA